MALAHFHQVQADLRESYHALTDAIPDVMAGYGALHDAAFVDGALDIKTKELIALSISITRECDGCIAAHGRNLARLGATTEEVAEMIAVSITMNGGPGLVWGPRALEAFLEYKKS
jgi:AhpD family alkylhydroperoxidase